MSSGLTEEELKAEIRRAVEADNEGAAEALFQEWERTHSRRAKAARAWREFENEVGRAFLAIPFVRWIFRRFKLTPKERFREEAG